MATAEAPSLTEGAPFRPLLCVTAIAGPLWYVSQSDKNLFNVHSFYGFSALQNPDWYGWVVSGFCSEVRFYLLCFFFLSLKPKILNCFYLQHWDKSIRQIYFGPQFQRFLSMVGCLCSFGLEFRASHPMATKKANHHKRPATRQFLKSMFMDSLPLFCSPPSLF